MGNQNLSEYEPIPREVPDFTVSGEDIDSLALQLMLTTESGLQMVQNDEISLQDYATLALGVVYMELTERNLIDPNM